MSRSKGVGCSVGLLAVLACVGWLWTSVGEDGSARSPIAKIAPASPARTSASPVTPESVDRLGFVDVQEAQQVLAKLPVKGRAPLTEYSREAFGSAWSDVNDNGCDTRNDILRRDLVDKDVEDCVVLSGTLQDPYSGQRVEFVRGPVTSLDVHVDHVVPLANAWQTGASYWTADQRERFANDRRNLLAVRGDLNLQKSDGDAATWLPPKKSFRCTYVSMQVLAKARYDLWVTAPEKAAMQRILSRC